MLSGHQKLRRTRFMVAQPTADVVILVSLRPRPGRCQVGHTNGHERTETAREFRRHAELPSRAAGSAESEFGEVASHRFILVNLGYLHGAIRQTLVDGRLIAANAGKIVCQLYIDVVELDAEYWLPVKLLYPAGHAPMQQGRQVGVASRPAESMRCNDTQGGRVVGLLTRTSCPCDVRVGQLPCRHAQCLPPAGTAPDFKSM